MVLLAVLSVGEAIADPSPDVYAICRILLKSGVEIEGFIQVSDYCENHCSVNGICYINHEGHKTIDYFNTTDTIQFVNLYENTFFVTDVSNKHESERTQFEGESMFLDSSENRIQYLKLSPYLILWSTLITEGRPEPHSAMRILMQDIKTVVFDYDPSGHWEKIIAKGRRKREQILLKEYDYYGEDFFFPLYLHEMTIYEKDVIERSLK